MGSVWSDRSRAKQERGKQTRVKAKHHNELLTANDINQAIIRHNNKLRREIAIDIANNILQLDVGYRYDTTQHVSDSELEQGSLPNTTCCCNCSCIKKDNQFKDQRA